MRPESTGRALLAALIPLLAVACGGASSSQAPAATPSPSPPALVKTAMASVDGKMTSVLVDGDKGLTLYWFTTDQGGKVSCMGGCLNVWPPLVLPSSANKPIGGQGVTGTLDTVMNPNGQTQVRYNTWPLYFYQKDTKPGDTTGQNVNGKWFVATPSLSANTTPPPSPAR